MKLSTDVSKIKGVGPKIAEQLYAAGLVTVRDLLYFLPRKHEDFTNVVKISDIQPGKATIKAHCEKIETRMVRRGLRVTTVVLADDTGKLNAVWFNQPYRAKQLDTSDEFYFSGEFEFQYNRYQLTNPSAEQANDLPVQVDRLLPVYRSPKGLKNQTTRKLLDQLRPFMTMVPESLPASIVAAEKLLPRSDALLGMHFPTSAENAAQARERLAFEELFQLILASQLNKQSHAKLEGYHIPFVKKVIQDFVAGLPFALTGAQRRAAWDILQDFAGPVEQQAAPIPMNRLLQGDVGSGKTVVAGIAARAAVHSGFQVAFMAPTEILASQHAETLHALLAPFGVRVALLVGSVKGSARKVLYEQIESGEVDVVVGTHALFQDKVRFSKLGFVVIDEQHRFGVEQRQRLLGKAKQLPHLLAMTATPIPRSLALTLYGELEVSVINERPKNRLPIKTKLIAPTSRQLVYGKIDAEIAKGRQAYVICSLIDDKPENDIKSVKAEHKKLQNSVFGHRTIGLLHGKLTASEKEEVMQKFKDKKYDILVTTTVVEVGVDVPNASIIMIENADQFGLSQLHQLRGRVGRADHQSYCYLMMSTTNKPTERLREIETSNDGFYLAEVDLKLRGPGEIYGKAQHGALNLQIATLADTHLIARAQKAAKRFIASGDNLLQYEELASEVQHYQRLTTLN